MGMYITLGIIALIVIVLISVYNTLGKKRNQIQNSISATDATFIKRGELLKKLCATAERAFKLETETLKEITALRGMNGGTNPNTESTGKEAVKNLMVQVENYPEIESSKNYRDLMHSMNEIDDQISAGRRYISASITDYNDSIVVFPNNILAGIFGFKKHEWQFATATQREDVDVNELFGS